MTAVDWLTVGLLAWIVLSVPVALLLAAFIDRGHRGPPDP